MRKTIAIFLLACLALSSEASAQDVFIKRSNNGQQGQSTKVIDLFPDKPVAENKSPPPQNPAPAVSKSAEPQKPEAKTAFDKDLAEKFYQDCISRPNAILTEESKKEFCACTSTKTMEEMSVEEIKTMFKDTASGQDMRNRMLIRVYTPCMGSPAKDLVYKSCIEDTAVSKNLKKPKAVCNCMASQMADYTVEHAPDVIIKALRHNAKDLDPLALLFEDTFFNAHAESVMTKCLYTQEFGWK